jgi:alkaline phosphatase D
MEVFFPDFRTYRDSNSDNNNPNGIAMMGRKQLDWLINAVTKSTATWKIISNHDPIGIVTGGPGDYDSFGQSDNAILGRELELKEFFDAVIAENVHNLVFLTTDVHFTAAIKYEQSRATYDTFFVPLYEFVVGPIHAGAFGPNNLDSSFGPEYEYSEFFLVLSLL